MEKTPSLAFARIRAEVLAAASSVPSGRVTTYGAIGNHLQVTPRHVAFVLARLPEEESAKVPWHRVVGAGGQIRQPDSEALQRHRQRLMDEGIPVSKEGRIVDFSAVSHAWPERVDGPGRPIRLPYAEPRTPPLFPESRRYGYPLAD
jgi:methylated-DNA-protein-cysteine methyltransferase-like protein